MRADEINERMVSGVAPARYESSGAEFDAVAAKVRKCFETLAFNRTAIFTTDAEGLFEAYLEGLPLEERQHHTCNSCRHFIRQYGGLVAIDANGKTFSATWALAERFVSGLYEESVARMIAIVEKAKITGVFLAREAVLGHPVTGPWTHFALEVPERARFQHPLFTAKQAMAAKREDFKNVLAALEEFPAPVVDQAVTILESEALSRSEKFLAPAKFLQKLHTLRASTKNTVYQDNHVWEAVATAPAGFCHPRSGMIGTLLTDIAAGRPFEDIKRRFQALVNPTQYQRPQAPPSAGNIAQAEKIVEALGISRSLQRRYARLEEVRAIWRPAPATEAPEAEGVFGHLKPKAEVPPVIVMSQQTMTWAKFRDTVLPDVVSMEIDVPKLSASFCGILTAADLDAPPILQWDQPDERNPFSWYYYPKGSMANDWNLGGKAKCEVSALCLQPSQWMDDKFNHFGAGVFFVVQDARDLRYSYGGRGNGLFPEMLKSELHQVRATIEAFSAEAKLTGVEEATACGMMFQSGGPWPDCTFRVTLKAGSVISYKLDRWD